MFDTKCSQHPKTNSDPILSQTLFFVCFLFFLFLCQPLFMQNTDSKEAETYKKRAGTNTDRVNENKRDTGRRGLTRHRAMPTTKHCGARSSKRLEAHPMISQDLVPAQATNAVQGDQSVSIEFKNRRVKPSNRVQTRRATLCLYCPHALALTAPLQHATSRCRISGKILKKNAKLIWWCPISLQMARISWSNHTSHPGGLTLTKC